MLEVTNFGAIITSLAALVVSLMVTLLGSDDSTWVVLTSACVLAGLCWYSSVVSLLVTVVVGRLGVEQASVRSITFEVFNRAFISDMFTLQQRAQHLIYMNY